jgi:adenylate cyclase
MHIEIERKFLVIGDGWRHGAIVHSIPIRQGYISGGVQTTVRVRSFGSAGKLTIKGPTENLSKMEFEYDIPLEDANILLDTLCGKPLIEKTRHEVEVEDAVFVVDEFFGMNAGLVLAEIELTDEEAAFPCPSWLGKEVSFDYRYTNASLAANPYPNWG